MVIWTFKNMVCAAGDIRNDLYLTLERGDFERGGKSVQKNVEVTVFVLYADGEILKVPAETETSAALPKCFLLALLLTSAHFLSAGFDVALLFWISTTVQAKVWRMISQLVKSDSDC